jgi:hypothetical protein
MSKNDIDKSIVYGETADRQIIKGILIATEIDRHSIYFPLDTRMKDNGHIHDYIIYEFNLNWTFLDFPISYTNILSQENT